MPAEDAPAPEAFDGVVLGDSIHATRHSRHLQRYIGDHVDALNRLPVGLFQVSLTSATADEEHDELAHGFLQRLLDATGLQPDLVGLFAGAIAFTRIPAAPNSIASVFVMEITADLVIAYTPCMGAAIMPTTLATLTIDPFALRRCR